MSPTSAAPDEKLSLGKLIPLSATRHLLRWRREHRDSIPPGDMGFLNIERSVPPAKLLRRPAQLPAGSLDGGRFTAILTRFRAIRSRPAAEMTRMRSSVTP